MKKRIIVFCLIFGGILISVSFIRAIPNPASTYCLEQGYTWEDGVCIFRDGNECEEWAFYNGECGDEYRQELACKQAGEEITVSECCEGLATIERQEVGSNGECLDLIGGWAICSDCGNGICESWENKCNCQQDCLMEAAEPGDLIKTLSSPAIYYLDTNNVKHPFHHEREFFTWYNDFSEVKTISANDMTSYTLGSTITVRPGSRLVQFVEILSDGSWNTSNTPEVYAVGLNGTLHYLTSPNNAVNLYGEDWESMIMPLPNYLVVNYTFGDFITSTYPTGTLVKTTNNEQIYYINGAIKQLVTDEGFLVNRFNLDYVVVVDDLSNYPLGEPVDGIVSEIYEPLTCIITGCSSQLCSATEVITTCEVQPWYSCYSDAICERQVNGECGWTLTNELTQCLEENGAQ